jgi:succinyl-diaminopimelate desuccinylase
VTPYFEKISRFLQENEAGLRQLTQDLVRAPSVNPPGDESAVIDILTKKLEEFGVEYEVLEHGPSRKSLVAVYRGAGEKGALVFSGHGDTVPVGEASWERDPFSGEESDGRIHGRGATDMKGGVASIIHALGAVANAKVPLQGDLIVAITAGEETDSLGANALCETNWLDGADKLLIAEPSNLNVFTAEKGALWISVRARGKSAHGSMPHLGVNAIEHLMDFLQKLRQDRNKANMEREHPLLGRSTISVDVIKGGVATNVVADEAWCAIDIRTLPGEDHQEILSLIEKWIEEQKAATPGLAMEIDVLNDRAAYEIAEDHELVETLSDVIEDVHGRKPEKMGAAFYTDGSVFWPKCKIPMVICGPGEISLMHKPDEYIEIKELLQAPRIFAEWALRLLT